jgi:hypothetical protein
MGPALTQCVAVKIGPHEAGAVSAPMIINTLWLADDCLAGPQDSLYAELAGDQAALAAAGISGLYRIGYAVPPRMISGAIFDGHRLAQEINQEDPAQPSPCQPERADLT